jgi:hypothetical protein
VLELDFAGWFQCRLATDPDAYDHPRGESGWTFAVPGEPDLDRVIRFSAPVAPRSHAPAVGVTVRAVRAGGAAAAAHPLLGAPVELLDGAVYEGRNGDIAQSAREPVVPFRLSVAAGGVRLVGFDPIDLTDPASVARRQPTGFEGNSAEVRAATGVADPAAYRAARRAQLQADLAAETDPTRRQALQLRIDQLALGSVVRNSLGFKLPYRFELRGPNRWDDPAGALGPPPAAGAVWTAAYWMGGWDADALQGYVSGTLRVG